MGFDRGGSCGVCNLWGLGGVEKNGGSCPCGFGPDTIRRQAGSSGVVRFFRTFGGFTTGLWKKVGSDTATNPRVGKNFGFSQGGCGGDPGKGADGRICCAGGVDKGQDRV